MSTVHAAQPPASAADPETPFADGLRMHDPDAPLMAEAVVDLAAISSNTAQLRSRTSAQVMVVVKADGYGHGIVAAARAALRGGATWLGVCTLEESLALRSAGITAPVLAWLLAPNTPLDEALRANVDISAADLGMLGRLVESARRTGVTARVHLKLDTGLGRNGAAKQDWADLVDAAAKAQAEGAIDVIGIWSHFAYADEPGHPTIAAQLSVFDEGLATVAKAGIKPVVRHIANSAASLTLPQAHYDLIRPGISAYGFSPMPGREREFGLRPAMTLRAQVVLAKRVAAGSGVSYGHEYTTSGETTLALIPLGYADGISRAASGKGPIQLGNARRHIAGRVCMDQVVIDVGDDLIRAGDIATIFGPGDQGEPTANDWAELLGTISYEIVSRVGGRVPRTYRV